MLDILRKVWTQLSKPKTIRVGINEEIKLTNIAPELVAKIEALVESGSMEVKKEVMIPASSVSMNNKAVGTFKNRDGVWCVGLIQFDAETGQAKVEKIFTAGTSKPEAAERFRILAVQEGLV